MAPLLPSHERRQAPLDLGAGERQHALLRHAQHQHRLQRQRPRRRPVDAVATGARAGGAAPVLAPHFCQRSLVRLEGRRVRACHLARRSLEQRQGSALVVSRDGVALERAVAEPKLVGAERDDPGVRQGGGGQTPVPREAWPGGAHEVGGGAQPLDSARAVRGTAHAKVRRQLRSMQVAQVVVALAEGVE